MGSESTTPPNLTDDKTQNQGSEPLKLTDGADQGAPLEITRITSPSVFVNLEPIREDQVQNAVKFLSHPRVQGSPVIYRRSFLEKKGLSREEIDEAFRRVPDPPPPATTTPSAYPNQDDQSKLASNSQTQVSVQASQPAVSPRSVVSTLRTRFHWSHVILAIGFLAASGAGTALLFKNFVVPRLKSWIRKVVLDEEEDDDFVKKNNPKPSLAEEAAAAAKAASAAAVDVAKASREMLNSKTEEKKYLEAFMNMLNVQLGEMKNMSHAIRKLEYTRKVTVSSNKQIEDVKSASRNGPSNTQLRNSLFDQDYETVSYTGLKQAKPNGMTDFGTGSGIPSSAPASMKPSVALNPKSYMETTATVQRGEKPSGIKPWETAQAQDSSYYSEGSSWRSQDNVSTSQLYGDGTKPSWQRKNVRISEFKPEDESKTATYRATTNEQVVRRAWVPPQPPPIFMPEAAAAIRQPKQTIQTDQLDDERLIARPSVETDELQRITKISEFGG